MSIRTTTALLGLFLCILSLPAAFSNDESAVPIPHKEDEGIVDNAPLETINTNQAQDIGVPADARPPVSRLPGLPPINDHDIVHAQDYGFPIAARPLVGFNVGLGNGLENGVPWGTTKCTSRGGRCYQSAQCCGGFCHSYARRCVN